MEWWQKMVIPMQRVWIVVAKRVGIRKSGLLKLRHDVKTCEYDDIHVLWDMLKKNETEPTGSSKPRKKHFWNVFEWARNVPYMCRSF